MAVTSGFFNSVNGDRKYDSEQFGSLFSTVISDGVNKKFGNRFEVTFKEIDSDGNFLFNVGTGRAFFNSHWILNDSLFEISLPALVGVNLKRKDAIVIEVNLNDNVRACKLKSVQGAEGSEFTEPTIIKSNTVIQYPIAYISIDGSSSLNPTINNTIGSSDCPFSDPISGLPIFGGTKNGSIVLNSSANTATGDYSHAEGGRNTATGNYSHAEGVSTIANGIGSHAEGGASTANGNYSHAEGANTNANGEYSHAEGYTSIAEGNHSHAEGINTVANGSHSHAEGYATTANGDGSHAEGYTSIAEGNHSHAEGYTSISNGIYSHAEGANTIAIGDYSHAEGRSSTATGIGSHAEGYACDSINDYSHVEGNHNVSSRNYQHVQGEWADTSNTDLVDVVGGGTGTAEQRANLETLDINGDKWILGTYKAPLFNQLVQQGAAGNRFYHISYPGIYVYTETVSDAPKSGILVIKNLNKSAFGSTGLLYNGDNQKFAEGVQNIEIVYPLLIFSDN